MVTELLATALFALQPDPSALVPLFRQALAEREERYGPDHERVARLASSLGLLLRSQGGRAAAEPLLRRALAIDERTLGAASRLAGEDLENLASVVDDREALTLYDRAARHADPEVAARNLARLAARATAEQAAALYRQALAKEEQASGPAHPRVAVRLNDLALALPPPDAEPLLRRALLLQQRKLGPKHPETATTENNLANVLLALGKLAAAEPLQRRALATLEQTLGPRHPRVAAASSNLADILRSKKDFSGAHRLYERALQIDEAAYGPSHPEVAADLRNLAALLEEMGQAAEARKLAERADQIPQ
jgi:hypothetical protein